MKNLFDPDLITHSLLKKQLERSGSFNESERWPYFLKQIDMAYCESDRERRITEHTMEVMSEEIMEINQGLMAQTNELLRSQERYLLVAKAASDGLWDWDLKTNRIYYSSRWWEMLNLVDKEQDSSIEDWFSRIHHEDVHSVHEHINHHILGGSTRLEVECRIKTNSSQYIWVLIRGLAARDEKGKAVRLAGSQTDITLKKKQDEALYKAAFHDELTGLANRALFMNRLEQVILRKRRLGEKRAALMFVDLDRFKYINDTMGHEYGDEVLKLVASVLKSHTRPTDTVARLGGDEFTVIFDPIDDIEEAKFVAQRIITQLNRMYELAGREIYVSSSIGLTMIDHVQKSPETILRNADLAMYEAKSRGKSRLEIFDQHQYDRLLEKMELTADLRQGKKRNQFEVFYQPIIDMETGAVTCFEALMRWLHPKYGYVSPAKFIPLAEETGLIGTLGQWVLDKVIVQMHAWCDVITPQKCPSISVNISVKQLMDDMFYKKVLQTLDVLGQKRRLIRLEVTESVIMADPKLIIERLKSIHELGVILSIDDFGTGYSSLSYLHNYPFDLIKIDQSFIATMLTDHKSERLVASLIKLSQDLGLKTVAEGIETEGQCKALHALGCTYGQGYLFSEALPPVEASHIVFQGHRYTINPYDEDISLLS